MLGIMVPTLSSFHCQALINNFCRTAPCKRHLNATFSSRLLLTATRVHSPSDLTRQPVLPFYADAFPPHTPVLLSEVLSFFQDKKVVTFVDGTLGAGGHAEAILQQHPEIQKFIGLDVDLIAHGIAEPRLKEALASSLECKSSAELCLHRSNFDRIGDVLASEGVTSGTVDGILLDIGVSSMQVDESHRGFSFMKDGPLDMRMNSEMSLIAADVVNSWNESEIGRIIRDYGEDRGWRHLARKIVEAREKAPINTTIQLAQIIGGSHFRKGKGFNSGPKIHPATRTFQALRIAVNDELGALERVIPQAIAALTPGGRLAIITFHSLEDRIVKRAFLSAASGTDLSMDESWRAGEKQSLEEAPGKLPADEEKVPWKRRKDVVPTGATVKILTKRPVVASETEIQINGRSRSAKLRVVEKI